MRRVSIVGSPGSGKTTVAAALSSQLGLQHIELDSLFHQEDWEPKPRDDFRAEVGALMASGSWIVDGNYGSKVRDLVWAEADTVVWLDLSKPRVMTAVFFRTLRRVFGRTRLWNDNRERLRNLFATDPEENLLVWTWTRFAHYRETYASAMLHPALAHVDFVHLRTRREIRDWLDVVT